MYFIHYSFTLVKYKLWMRSTRSNFQSKKAWQDYIMKVYFDFHYEFWLETSAEK